MPNFLVIDVQPAYHDSCKKIVADVCQQLNTRPLHDCAVMFVGHGLTEDTEDAVRYYLTENGLDEERAQCLNVIEKDYAFLRNWIDYNIDDDVIVKTLQHMKSLNIHDSRDLPETTLNELATEHGDFIRENCIFLPNINKNRIFSKDWILAGGGADECLKEIEIWMKAEGYHTERDHKLIYSGQIDRKYSI